MVLIDIIARLGFKPQVIYTDSQMEYPETIEFVKEICNDYKLKLHIVKSDKTPIEIWRRYGYPMLGKQSAREWMQTHRDLRFGYKLDVSTCCDKLKIRPARMKIKELGCNMNITGQRGNNDDRLRGMRAKKDGVIRFVKSYKLFVCNPLTGWTDLMVKRYIKQHKLKTHPLRGKGLLTTGCIFCGGGAQFTNSGFRVLRKIDKKNWEKMIRNYGFGEIILSIKYDEPLEKVREAIKQYGGLKKLMREKPYIFDFLREIPLNGYNRQ